MPLQLGTIHPSKNPISIPDDLSLSFTLEVNSPGSYVIYYKLSPSSNLYFINSSGENTKSITETVSIVDTNSLINKGIEITQSGQKIYSYFFIRVEVKQGTNGDIKSCRISII